MFEPLYANGVSAATTLLDAAKNARPVLLEPVMRVEVVVPREHLGDVLGDLADRRGLIHSLEELGASQVIQALAPMSEMFGYGYGLQSRTRGRATYSLHFDRYQRVHVDPNIHDDDRDSLVGAPLKPVPRPNDSGVALPRA
jgi:translation elongation factor EF-G